MPKEIILIKNRSDIGAGTRGSDIGIDALEVAAINKGDDYFNRYDYVDVETFNESIYNKVRNTFARRIEDVYKQCKRVAATVKETLETGNFPLVFSGDHSSALGTISGIKAAFPDKVLGVVWIDAHADLHSPYTSPSGNIHGMPLAAALGDDNRACEVNEVSGDTEVFWQKMKRIGGISAPKLQPEHLVYFGVRDTESPEDVQMQTLGIRNYTVSEVRFRGLQQCVNEALARLDACDMVYISYDVDSMDCDMVSYGTGTPVAKGFDPLEVQAIMTLCIASQKVVCMEICEVNPLLDTKGNKMAETAFDVWAKVTEKLEEVMRER